MNLQCTLWDTFGGKQNKKIRQPHQKSFLKLENYRQVEVIVFLFSSSVLA